MRDVPWPFCRVDTDGISHLFRAFDVGRHCACGRAVAALCDDEREVVIRRASAVPRRAPAPPAPPRRRVSRLDEHEPLQRGDATIAYARALRARVIAQRIGIPDGRRRRAAARAVRSAPGWHGS